MAGSMLCVDACLAALSHCDTVAFYDSLKPIPVTR